MNAVLRCICGRCAGGVTYLRVSDFVAAHQLEAGEYVLDRDVELCRERHPARLASVDRRATT